jgi:hypothetical protein
MWLNSKMIQATPSKQPAQAGCGDARSEAPSRCHHGEARSRILQECWRGRQRNQKGSSRSVLPLNQTILNCIMGEFGIGFHVHLFQQACTVSTDGLGAKHQFSGYFLDFLSGSNQTQHLILAI